MWPANILKSVLNLTELNMPVLQGILDHIPTFKMMYVEWDQYFMAKISASINISLCQLKTLNEVPGSNSPTLSIAATVVTNPSVHVAVFNIFGDSSSREAELISPLLSLCPTMQKFNGDCTLSMLDHDAATLHRYLINCLGKKNSWLWSFLVFHYFHPLCCICVSSVVYKHISYVLAEIISCVSTKQTVASDLDIRGTYVDIFNQIIETVKSGICCKI